MFNNSKLLFIATALFILFLGLLQAQVNQNVNTSTATTQDTNTTSPTTATSLTPEITIGYEQITDGLIKGFKQPGKREVLWLLLILCAFAVAIIAERLYILRSRYNINGIDLMNKIQNFVIDNQIDRAIKLCNEKPEALLCKVLKAGLKRATRPHNEIQAAVDVAILEALSILQKRTSYLPLIANLATLTGLLGTVIGLIISFGGLANVDAAEKQNILALGISMAMYATAMGLTVAILSLIGYGYIMGKTQKIIDEIDMCSAKIVDLLNVANSKS